MLGIAELCTRPLTVCHLPVGKHPNLRIITSLALAHWPNAAAVREPLSKIHL